MTPRDVLVVKPSSMGDVLHTLPAVHALKRTYPDAKLRWLVNPEWAPLLAGNPDLEEIIFFPRSRFRGTSGLVRGAAWAKALARLQPDLALDFQGLLRSALLSRAARPKCVLGLADAREGARWFYDRTAGTSPTQHAVERYLALAALAGADVAGEAAFPLPAGQAPPDFARPPGYVLLHPFARGRGKSLALSEVVRLTEALDPLPVVLVGVGTPCADLPRNAVSLLNKTSLLELTWLTRNARFILSVDSGPMHLAAALTGELLSIHFWSDPRRIGPYRPEAWVWKQGLLLRVRDLPGVRFRPRASARPDPGALALFVHERLLRADRPAVN